MRVLLFALIAVAIILLFGGAAIDSSMTGGDREDIADESWTPVVGEPVELEHSNLPVRYDPRVEVHDHDANKMIEGHDYEWHNDNGTVTALEDGRLSGANNANISYGFSTADERQENVVGLYSEGSDVVAIVLIFGMGLLLLLAMGRFIEQ